MTFPSRMLNPDTSGDSSKRCSSPLIKVPRITLPMGFDGWAPFKPDRSQVTVCLSPAFHTELAVGLVMGGDIASRGRKASGFPRTVMARVSRRNTTCMTAESRDMRDEA